MSFETPFVLSKFDEMLKELGKEELHPKESLYVNYRKVFYAGFMWALFMDPVKETFFITMIDEECIEIKASRINEELLVYHQFIKLLSQPFCPITVAGRQQVEEFLKIYAYGVHSVLNHFFLSENYDKEQKQEAIFECYICLGAYCNHKNM